MAESTFQKWYQNHKSEFNEDRRKRYHSDPEYRQRVIDYAKISRERAKLRPKPPKKLWSISEAAEKAGTTTAAIRYWEEKKFIPKPETGQQVRKYNKHQIELMRGFFEEMDRLLELVKNKEIPNYLYEAGLQQRSNHVKKEWDRGSEGS